MKNLLFGVLVLGSMSAFGDDIILNCVGSSIKVLDKFSYTEEKRLMNIDLTINSEKSAMIIFDDNEMKIVKQKSDIANKKGSSILYVTQAREEDDTLIEGVNVFHATLNSNSPGNNEDDNLKDDLDVKAANIYTGSSFSMMDIERRFGLSCVRN